MKTTPIFKQNAREYTVLNSDKFGKIVQVEVGALLVGRIANHRLIGRVKKGQEKGYFSHGASTIVVIVQQERVSIDKDILEMSKKNIEVKVQYGEKVGKIIKSYR
jgi:phosphatidylserine decarboxylase